MLRRKKKNKHRLPAVEVSVVSLMDILTTLLFFLLLFASFTKFTIMPATSLPAPSAENEEKKPMFVLEITLRDPRNATIWLGPTAELKVVDPDSLMAFMSKRFEGNSQTGFYRKIEGSDLKSLLKTVQMNLVEIKKSFPSENKAVVAISDRINYQSMIDAVTTVRSLSDDDQAFTLTNLLGKTERTKVLFPEVVLSEVVEPTQGEG